MSFFPSHMFLDAECECTVRFRGRSLHYVGFWHFPSFVVLNRYDSTVRNSGVFEETSFQFSWCNLMALSPVVSTDLERESLHTCQPQIGFQHISRPGALTLTLISSFIRSTIQTCSLPLGAFRNTTSSPVRIYRPSDSSTKVSCVARSF